MLVVFFIRGWAAFAQSTLMNYAGQSIVVRLQNQLFAHIVRADMAFFARRSPGSLTSRFTLDSNLMRGAVSGTLTSLGRDFLTVVGLTGMMFYQDWLLACIASLVLPLAVLPITRIGKRMRKNSHSTQQEVGQLAVLLDEAFQGIRQVKAHGMEAYEESRVRNTLSRLFRLVTKAERTRSYINPALDGLCGLAIAAVMVYGGHRVIHGHSTPGDFFSFLTAAMLSYDPLKRLSSLNAGLQEGLAAAERVFGILDSKPVVVDNPGAKPLKIAGGALTLSDVTFTYDGETKALERFDLSIPAGIECRPGRRVGRRQDHGLQSDPALLRSRQRPPADRWSGSPPDDAGFAAQLHRAGEPGQHAVRRHGPPEHPLRQAAGEPGRAGGRDQGCPCRHLHRTNCHRVTTRRSARAACGSPAASASAS